MFSILNPIKLNSSERVIWFTADCHFNHNQEFIYNKRSGLHNVDEYNEWLIELWNRLIAPEDVVFDLGDFMFSDGSGKKTFSILERLNGQHYLLWGNHNSGVKTVFKDQVHYPYTILDKVHYLGHYAEAVIDRQPMVMCHYPITSWNDMSHGTWMLHGHCHGSFDDVSYGKIQDVGLDVFARPITFVELKEVLDARPIMKLDQHDADTRPSRRW